MCWGTASTDGIQSGPRIVVILKVEFEFLIKESPNGPITFLGTQFSLISGGLWHKNTLISLFFLTSHTNLTNLNHLTDTFV